jgi:dUTP pyrophosphatase
VLATVDVPIRADRLPSYARPGDAGADLHSTEDLVLARGERASVGTGVAIALPEGHAGLVVPRSGLAFRHGITIVNAPGTIDAGYRGEIRVALLNTDADESYRVSAGDRIAQLVIVPVVQARFTRVDELPESVRGTSGFGSTGYAAGARETSTTEESA